ncbi:hypothetical protein [Metapseudomonas resinovorans]|uniref:hypothetical protein n=1 Tax=Metapseudomonas resinovorans TaxID=53412 RepID=UPI000415FDC3|nr:hypothetical protein [Pseudomonas resinovorans]MDE3736726.1 hypothetical protein [Pseudomonas resinovorans]
MSSRAFSRVRRNRRWPVTGACLWLFLMTLLGAELAGGDLRGAFPDEGHGQGQGRGRTERGHEGTGL